MSNKFEKETFWQDVWERHIETYLAGPPRCGYWLDAFFSKNTSVLEIAGGSCRDSRYLASQGYEAMGTDFDQKILDYLEEHFPDSPLPLLKENAFNFSFPDKSFDLSFSNGFWIVYPDDQKICSLLHEQARITRKYLIALVHNAENKALIKRFKERAKEDPLYDIRFFYRDELQKIISSSGIKTKKVILHKFGGPLDHWFAKKIKGVFPNPLRLMAYFFVPRLYRLQPWKNVERIACVIELE